MPEPTSTPDVRPPASPVRAAHPFALGDVELHDGAFLNARDRVLRLARAYPADRLLAVFRANASLDTRGARPPGGWEDFGHPQEDAWGPDDYPGREVAPTANLLRGHYAGHFLSMLSMAWAGTGERTLREKVDELVTGLRECQQALAATGRYSHQGFLAAYGEWQFARLEDLAPYGEIWAPYYTCHKIMAGLLDAYRHVGSTDALGVAEAMGRWVHNRLAPLAPARRQQMWSLYIAGETGGMNEVLCDLAQITGDQMFIDTARLFDLETLLEPAASGKDVLEDMHANQHAATLPGYLKLHDLTGEDRYLAAVANIWDMVVPGRTYAHGGSGENELWGPAGVVAGDIGTRNAETCVAYNLLKVADALFERTGDARYADYAERAVTNQILGSKRAVDSDASPEVTYMFPVHPGALREYDNVGTCCGGTGLENHVKYQQGVYARAVLDGRPTLWVTRYLPSSVRWADVEVGITQETASPLDGRVRLTVDATGELDLRLRVPEWVITCPTVRVDGQPAVPVQLGPRGSATAPGERTAWLAVRRRWRPGTIVELDLGLPLRAVPAPDDPNFVSLELGPTVLLARHKATTWLPVATAAWRRLDGTLEAPLRPIGDGTLSLDGLVLEPAWSGADSRYHMYLRRADPTVAFAETDSRVPNVVRQDGLSFLDVLWSPERFASRQQFLAAVLDTTREFVGAGLMGSSEARAVLLAAARSRLGRAATGSIAVFAGPNGEAHLPDAIEVDARRVGVVWQPDGAHRTDAGPTDAHRPAIVPGTATDQEGAHPVEAVIWYDSPAAAEGSAPRVSVSVSPAPSVTGWFRQHPQVTVDARADAELVRVDLRVDDGTWEPAAERDVVVDDGVHVVAVRAVDSAGRERHTRRELPVDTEPPRTEARVRRLGSHSAEITFIAVDSTSGVDAIRWRGPDTFWATFAEPFTRALTTTPQVIEFAATDRAGNAEPVQHLQLPPAG